MAARLKALFGPGDALLGLRLSMVVALCMLAFGKAPVLAAPGDLDTSWGAGGKVTTDLMLRESPDNGRAVVVQPDGKVVVGGFITKAKSEPSETTSVLVEDDDFGLVRYNTDGSLDTSFNGTGIVTTDLGSSIDCIKSVTLQGTDIVVAGNSASGSKDCLAVARYNSDGSLDTGFGGTGKVVTSFGAQNSEAWAVAADGTDIIVAGTYRDGDRFYFGLARFKANGTFDVSFGGTGKVVTAVGSRADLGFAMVLDGTDVIVAGATATGASFDCAVVRYNRDGSLDTGFGGTGKVVTSVSAAFDYATAMVLDGTDIVIAGHAQNGSQYDFMVVRYNADGSLDTGLGGTGKVTFGMGAGDDFAYSVMIDGTDIIVTGDASNGSGQNFAVARLNSNGTLDSSLGGTGKVMTAGTGKSGAGALLGTDILVVGIAWSTGSSDFAVARYNSNGSLDTAFSSDGIVTTNLLMLPSDDYGRDLAIQPDGKFVVAGHTWLGLDMNRIVLVRYNRDGSLDSSFGTGGVVISAAGADQAASYAMVLDGTDIVVAGYANAGVDTENDFAVLRFKSDGSPDTSFGGDGIVTTDFGSTHDTALAITLDGSDVVVVGEAMTFDASSFPVRSDFAVARYNRDGSLDTAFGGTGKVTTSIGATFDSAYAVVMDGSDVIVAGGSTAGNENFALVRYNSDGSLDSSFSDDGKLTRAFGAAADAATAVIISSNRIIVAGYGKMGSDADVVMARYNRDGTLDTSFGIDGTVSAVVGGSIDYVRDIVMDGTDIILGGRVVVDNKSRLAVWRYNFDGSPDTGFGNDGKVVTAVGASDDRAHSLALDGSDIVLVGSSLNGVGYDLAVVRYKGGSNAKPVSSADSYNGAEDTTLNVAVAQGVLANDVDGEGGALQAELVAGPANGLLTLNPNGSFSYAPAANFNGSVTFTYRASDGVQIGNTQTVTLNIAAVNDPPTISPIANVSIAQGTATSALTFTIGDLDTAVGGLVVSRTSSNNTLVPLTGIVFGGSEANRTVTVTPNPVQSGTSTISITVSDGAGGTTTSSFVLTVIAKPNILNVNPYSAGVGTTVGVSGANYTVPGGVTSVTFNGIAASFTQNGSLINAIVPVGNVNGPVRVTTAGGTAVSASNFTLVPTPQVLSFSPLEGGYGTQVSFSGNNLLGATSVRVNGTRATEFTVVSKNLIRFTVPTGCLPGKISVVTPGGIGESANNFVVYPPPGIGAFSPATGNIGSTVSISGNYFSSVQSVKFNNQFTTSFLQVNNNLIRVAVPAGATTGKLTVITKGGSVVSSSTFTVILRPNIAVFSPTSGTPGTLVSFSGNNLSGVSIAFNGVPATSVTQVSASMVRAVVPAGATTGKVSATNSAGDVGVSSADFTVFQAPVIAGFTPVTGPVGTGVIITGSNFIGATAVKFNTTAAEFSVDNAGQITATVPAGATTGKITVTGPVGSGVSTQSFTVTAGTAPPAIAGFSPTSGAAGNTVVLVGTGFSGATTVQFTGAGNTRLPSNYRVDSAQQITATVPNDTVTGVIHVTTPGGTAVSNGVFTILKTPVIFSFTPATGPADTAVTLTGANFTGTTSVTFITPTGIAGAGFSLLSPTSIACNVPTNAITGKISVTNAFGTGQSTTNFLVAPRIETFTPATGPAGTVVTLNGRAFTGTTTVKFNGVAAVFTLVSPTQLQATVPVGATTGVISVTTPSGVGNSVGSFTVTP